MHTRRQQWIGCGCCLLGAAALVGLFAMVGGPFAPFVVGAAVLVVLVSAAAYQLHRWKTVAEFRATYGVAGKDVLIVYSNSPHWGEYIESHWVARWGERAVMFNRSRPWSAEQIEARLWRAWAGGAEHTPVAIVVPASGRTRVVRFWRAFRDRKHGDVAKLRAAEEELARMLGE